MYVVIFVFLDLSDYFVCEDLLARGEDGGGEAARVSGGGGGLESWLRRGWG